jgi:hypothetical protein
MFVQIFEVLTTVQGYLIHKTLFDSITGASLLDNCNPITSLRRHVTGPFPVSPVPVLAGEVAHRYRR